MDNSLNKDRIKTDNPHFIGNEMNFNYFSYGSHWCCDVTCLAKYPDNRKGIAKASYEFFDSKWELIAN